MNQQQDSRTPGNPYGMTTNKFWDFIPATGDKPPELLLYGAISSQQSWWEDRVTPQQFNQELAALGDVPEIIVRINSGGGDVFAANAIFTRLKDCSAKVTVKIDGWAASAATIIAMAGDTIKIARNGVFMIHDPAMTVWDTFRAEDFLKMADELKVIKQSIVNTYASKTGKKTEDIEQLMSNETWWTGDIAVENGFCDELMFEDSTTVVENSSKIVVNSVPIDVSMFKSIPTQLLNSPHNQNPGSLVNSATEPINKPKEKEEPEMAAPENKITTVDALKAAYPDLVATIQTQNVQELKALKTWQTATMTQSQRTQSLTTLFLHRKWQLKSFQSRTKRAATTFRTASRTQKTAVQTACREQHRRTTQERTARTCLTPLLTSCFQTRNKEVQANG